MPKIWMYEIWCWIKGVAILLVLVPLALLMRLLDKFMPNGDG